MSSQNLDMTLFKRLFVGLDLGGLLKSKVLLTYDASSGIEFTCLKS